MADSKIEWTERVWNPVRGCSIVSAGCKNCYAMKQARRFSGAGGAYEGLTQLSKNGPVWTGRARFVPEKVVEPLSWTKWPSRIFVNSMSDLFHDDVADAEIATVFAVMAATPFQTYQVLTKRPERMKRWFAWIADQAAYLRASIEAAPSSGHAEPSACVMLAREVLGAAARQQPGLNYELAGKTAWPLPNVWIGVSVENQKAADERLPLLLQTPAAVRWASVEPLLERVYFTWRLHPANPYVPEAGGHERGLDWVVVGGESGPSARPCAIEWIESVVRQCKYHHVPVFVKQLGAYVVSEDRVDDERKGDDRWAWRAGLKDRKGGDPSEWPHLNVRQFPEVRRA